MPRTRPRSDGQPYAPAHRDLPGDGRRRGDGPGIPQFGCIPDVVQPHSGDEKIPISLGHSRGSLLSTGGHRLSVQPAVPEPRKQGLRECRRSLGRVQCRRDTGSLSERRGEPTGR
ncbi:conserved hypothetical protein [Streptomyces sp. e14]|nr:conserved hypothetical protein [Streptomyces sp. e14]